MNTAPVKDPDEMAALIVKRVDEAMENPEFGGGPEDVIAPILQKWSEDIVAWVLDQEVEKMAPVTFHGAPIEFPVPSIEQYCVGAKNS